MATVYSANALLDFDQNSESSADDVFALPLSFAQQRLWFIDQLEPNNSLYNMPIAVRLSGELKVPALTQTLNEIVRRHEVLRTHFAELEGQPVQVIEAACERELELIDLSGMAAENREAEAARLMAAEAALPFDLSRGPLLRVKLLQLDETEHVLLLTMHHIISDGWSLGVLVKEVAALYEAYAQGLESPLAELQIQYADFAVWQREWLSGEVLSEQLGYWQEQLRGAPPVLELPTDRPRPAVQSFHGGHEQFALPLGISQELKKLSQREGVTLFMTLLAAWQTLLARYSGQTDVVIGTPIAGRNQGQTEELIGFFVNTLVLRSDLSGDPSFRELLARVREVTLGAYTHQDVPFEKLVEELQPERSLSHSPLFQVMFALQNAPMGELKLLGLALEVLETESETTKFDLTLVMQEREGELSGSLAYNTHLFEAATIERMTKHFVRLLEGVVRQPDKRLVDLPLMGASEEHQISVGWNATQSVYSWDKSVVRMFEEQVERSPENVAVVLGEEQTTYTELNRRANQLANHLRAMGVGPEVLVGVLLQRSVDMIVGLLGVLKAGGAYLPIDPAYPADRLAFTLEDARARALLTQTGMLEGLPDLAGLPVLCLDRDWEGIARQSIENSPQEVSAENLAYVIYTSGSSGRPKGVEITHRGLLNLVHWHQDAYDVTPSDRATQLAGVSFDASVWELWPYLTAGASIHFPDEETRAMPVVLRDWLLAQEITISFLPTPLAESILSLEWPRQTVLRTMLTGGDQLHHYPSPSLSFAVANHYGPTESTVVATSTVLAPADNAPALPPIGRPISNTQIYVLDAQLRSAPIGVPGELHISGASLARGYLGRPVLTAEKFIPNPFSSEPGARFYKTGDLARYLPNGMIEFLGRTDHQVKVRGFRIELGEIETSLMQHPAVRDCVVTTWQDGSGEKRLLGYVVADQKSSAKPGELRLWLQQRLPDYMLPSAFITLAELPLTAHGKIDRRALPAPNATIFANDQAVASATTPVEEMLIGIWCEVLRLEKIGVHDNFFELGGHSLQATQVISRMREIFQVELRLRLLFESPTIAGLAESVESGLKASRWVKTKVITAVSREKPLPLSFAQQRLWFIDRMESGSPFYNMPMAVHLAGQLNLAALAQTLNEVVRRHESLRTFFTLVAEQPMQVIGQAQPIQLPAIDLGQLSQVESETEVQRLLSEEAALPFDLSRGPLLRVKLLRLDETEHVLLLTMHHIISDGWSLGVLVKEVAALYEAYAQGLESPLAELQIQYADFAVWQREWLSGEVLSEQLGYWQEQLRGAPPVLELPTDRPRPAVQSFRGGHEQFQLSAELSGELKKLSQREGVTLFMTLLAAWQTLLARYSGQTDVVVGSPIANRNRKETEELIGFFVNTLALRSDLSGDPSFRELLARVREVTLGAYTHQDVPFEKLVEELQPERSLSHSALFQVMFVLQNASTAALQLSGVTLTPMRAGNDTAKFDLLLSLNEAEDGISGGIEYCTDLFDASTARRMVRHYETLLAGVVANPSELISRLPLLVPYEEQQLLVEWNATVAEIPGEQCVHDLFEQQVKRTPDSIAIVADEELTYRELNRRANQLGHYLRKAGIGPEDVVAICLERSVEMVVSVLAVMKSGGAYLPLDPEYPQERLGFMLEDSGAKVLLTQKHLQSRLPFDGKVLCLEQRWNIIAAENDQNPVNGAISDNLAYVIYTSGSTGKPKGVQLSHRNVVNFLFSMRQQPGLSADDTLFAVTTLSFDIAGLELYLPLSVGARVILASREVAWDGAQLLASLRKSGATVMQATPATWRLLAEVGWDDTKQLKMLCGGDALPRNLANQMIESGGELWNMYGPTETTIWSTLTRIESGAGPILIGRPIANTQIYIVDSNLQPVPIGVAGELLIGGEGLARGYLHRADLTSERFIPNPFGGKPGARLYRTGDSARYLADGNIEVKGRIDNQVKVRGFRIELGEIEGALREYPMVQDAAVIVREDVPGNKRLVAYVTPSTHHVASPDLEEEHVSKWQTIWDATYQPSLVEANAKGDVTFNLSGWNSSYTAEPIPEEEMKEWVERTVERILSLHPRKVLEIGCGTGLLLFRIAPHCAQYCGTDISAASLRYIRQQLATQELSGVSLFQQAAHDFSGIEEHTYDVVVLNSVAQYFPGIDYLVTMLSGAVNAVRPGGAIFLGDIRSLPLLEAFHASIELQRTSSATSKSELIERIGKELAKEKELTINPAFFLALKGQFPQISHVEIQHKRGRSHNELTRFRYDVLIHIEREVCGNGLTRSWKWEEGLSLPAIRQSLIESRPDYLTIAGVPNARVLPPLDLCKLLSATSGAKTVADIREQIAGNHKEPGIDPEAFWEMSDELPYAIDIHWAGPDADDRYDVAFKRLGISARPDLVQAVVYDESNLSSSWNSYANHPLREALTRDLAPQLRSYLREKLPPYMMPATYVVLEVLPLTPNGKVDRKALPAPEQTSSAAKVLTLPPRDLLELKLSRIWEDLLEIKLASVRDNFFELGGHSMLAVRLMARIEQWLGIRLPIAIIFRKPTVESLAGVLRQQTESTPTFSSLVEIQAGSSKPSFFCVHPAGGSVLCYAALAKYLGPDQPFIGLQSQLVDLEQRPVTSVDEMAANYVKAILDFQAEGPYLLGGWSMGGIVAFEMARQLHAQGKKVALLALLDARLPDLSEYVEPDELALISSFVQDLGLPLEGMPISETELEQLAPDEKLSYVLEQARVSGVLPPDIDLSGIRRLFQLFKTNVQAMLNYVPQSYAGRVALFRAAGDSPDGRVDSTFGWAPWVSEGLETYIVPGGHFTIVRRPHVKALAEQLRACLDAAVADY